MNPQDPKQKVPDDEREFITQETEEGFTLRFDWLVLGAILLGMIWYFGLLKGFLYFLGVWFSLLVFGVVLDYFEGDKKWD